MDCHFNSRYCSQCHAELTQDDYCHKHGWCKRCVDTVEVSYCKVPYWIVALIVALLGKVHLGL